MGGWRAGRTCGPGKRARPPHRASPHLPSARFMPASAAERGSADPLPARHRFRFKRQSASSTEEDEPETTQHSCSKATGSVRFLIPRPTRSAASSARSPCPGCPRRSRRRREETPPPGGHRPSHPSPRPRQQATDPRQGGSAAPANQRRAPTGPGPGPPPPWLCRERAQHPRRDP